MKQCAVYALLYVLVACSPNVEKNGVLLDPVAAESEDTIATTGVQLTVLGIAQDAGYPQLGCTADCCKDAPPKAALTTCLGLIDFENEASWLFEATPDLPAQISQLHAMGAPFPKGIFLTHAHIGHYTGLMFLGRESMNAQQMPVYVRPRMDTFLRNNGPWSQLVELNNIDLKVQNDSSKSINSNIRITSFLVPHRDEFSETVGYRIDGPNKSALFIPDIDKWERWDVAIADLIKEVDFAFVDATFYDSNELKNRDMSEIPHPFVVESMELLDNLPMEERNKIHFIHFNHSNPLLQNGEVYQSVVERGYKVAREGMQVQL